MRLPSALSSAPLAALLLSACALRMPELSMPDFSAWFDKENIVTVKEVGRANVCHTAGGEADVRIKPDVPGLMGWASAHGVELGVKPADLPDTRYAVVEFGQREHSGYGLAVSRDAGFRDGILILKATFFEPRPGQWSSSEPSSACVVVSLPKSLDFHEVRVMDQDGKVRAASEGRGS